MVRTRAQFKLDIAAQKAQGIYKNTSNSLTGASSASSGAIHYATVLPPPMARYKPRAADAIEEEKGCPAPQACCWHKEAQKDCILQATLCMTSYTAHILYRFPAMRYKAVFCFEGQPTGQVMYDLTWQS